MGLRDIINILLNNWIPSSWVDHSYLFGLAYLNAHYAGNGPHQASYDEIDNEWLACLHIYGTPPPIVEWDGWRTPSEGDIAQLHTLVDIAEDCPPAPRNSGTAPDHRLGLEAPAWLLVGQDGLVTHLILVFGSPVQSGLLTPRAMDRNRNRSIYFQFLKKTGPNRYGPVHIGFFRLQNWSEPVIVQTGSQPV